jgi:hypothetical protein
VPATSRNRPAYKAGAAHAEDHHGMHMLVPLERRMPAGPRLCAGAGHGDAGGCASADDAGVRKYLGETFNAGHDAVHARSGHWVLEGFKTYERLLTERPPHPSLSERHRGSPRFVLPAMW